MTLMILFQIYHFVDNYLLDPLDLYIHDNHLIPATCVRVFMHLYYRPYHQNIGTLPTKYLIHTIYTWCIHPEEKLLIYTQVYTIHSLYIRTIPRGGYSHTWAWLGGSLVMSPVFEILRSDWVPILCIITI